MKQCYKLFQGANLLISIDHAICYIEQSKMINNKCILIKDNEGKIVDVKSGNAGIVKVIIE